MSQTPLVSCRDPFLVENRTDAYVTPSISRQRYSTWDGECTGRSKTLPPPILGQNYPPAIYPHALIHCEVTKHDEFINKPILES